MAEFAQLGGQHPVLATIPVVNKAEGTQVMSKLFGQVSQVAMKEAISISKDHSNQQLLSGITQTQNIINDTKRQITIDPANAAKYAENSQKLLENVKNVPLNNSDRQKLNYYTGNANNTIDDHAFKIEFNQDQRIHQAAYYENMQSSLQSATQAIGAGDYAQFESLTEDWRQANKKALQTGIITPNAFANEEKLIQGYIQRAQIMHEGYANANVVEHNENLNSPLVPTTDVQTRPIDPGTQHLFNHYQHLRTTDDLNNAIAHGSHNPEVKEHLFNLPEQQFVDKYTLWSGANNVNAMMQSNHNFEELNQLNKDLDSKKDQLTTYQKGQLNRLNSLFNNLSNGEYINVMNSTGEGARLTDNLNKQLAAIRSGIYYESTPELVEQKKSELTNQAMNQYYSNMYSLGEAMHIPSKFIRSLPQQLINHASQAFEQDGNPQDLINNINSLSSENRVELAKGLKKPEQQEIAYTIGMGSNYSMLPKFKNDVVKAQQPNAFDDKLIKQSSKKSTTDYDINAYILSEFGRTKDFIGNQPDGANRTAALLKSGVNYVKYQAYQNQDYELKNIKDYMKEYVQQINTAYDVSSNFSITYNKKQNPNYTESDMSHVSNYMRLEAEKTLKENGRDVDVFKAKGNLNVSILPNNIAVVTDDFGAVLARHPLNDNLISLSYKEHKVSEEKLNKEIRRFNILMGVN
jgi:hypothetical protein